MQQQQQIEKQKQAMHRMKEMMFNLSFVIYLQMKLQAYTRHGESYCALLLGCFG